MGEGGGGDWGGSGEEGRRRGRGATEEEGGGYGEDGYSEEEIGWGDHYYNFTVVYNCFYSMSVRSITKVTNEQKDKLNTISHIHLIN